MEPFPFLSVLESPTIVPPLSECQKGTVTIRGDGSLLGLVEFNKQRPKGIHVPSTGQGLKRGRCKFYVLALKNLQVYCGEQRHKYQSCVQDTWETRRGHRTQVRMEGTGKEVLGGAGIEGET